MSRSSGRSVSLLLLSALLIPSVFTACGETEVPAETAEAALSDTVTEPVTETETLPVSNLPSADFEGRTFTLLSQDQSSVAWATVTFTVDEQDGDIINDTIFIRNSRVMEKYNFELVTEVVPSAVSVVSNVRKTNAAGESAYNAALASYCNQNSLATEGMYMDAEVIPHLELDRDIWDHALLDNVRINNTSYLLTGDLLLTDKDCVLTTIYNKALADDYDIGGSDLYNIVREGKWTFEKLTEYGKMVSEDLNGDGIYDYRDRFGLLTNLNDTSGNASVAFILACGARFCEIGKDGTPIFMPDTDKFISAMDAASNLLDPKNLINLSYSGSYPGLTARQAIVTWFNSKQALFTAVGLSAGAQYMRQCDVDFGYLPVPKYDEEQENYISHIDTRCPVLGIPVIDADPDFTGFILEALCEESGDLMHEYFETCFSAKYTRDEESYEMLMIAVNNRRYDIGLVFDFGKMITAFDKTLKRNDGTAASTVESIRPAVEESIREFMDLTKGQ